MTSPLPGHILKELLEAAGPACWETLLEAGQSDVSRSDLPEDILVGLLGSVQDEDLFALPGLNLLKLKYAKPGSNVNVVVVKASAYGDITILHTVLRLAWSRVGNGRARVLLSWCLNSALVSAAELGDVRVVRTLREHGASMDRHAWALLIQNGEPECLSFASAFAPEKSWKSALLRCMEQGKDQEAANIYNAGKIYFDPAAVVVAGSWFGRHLVKLPAALGCVEISIVEKRLLCGNPLLSVFQWFSREPTIPVIGSCSPSRYLPVPCGIMENGEGHASTAQVLKYVIVNFQAVPEDSPPLDDVLLDLQMEGDVAGMDAVIASWDKDE
jgi:hypothetical protein